MILTISTPLRRSIKPSLNRGHLAFVRRQPCAVCGSCRGVQAAHVGPRGLGTKAPALQTIPLCWGHHTVRNDSIHALGPVKFARVQEPLQNWERVMDIRIGGMGAAANICAAMALGKTVAEFEADLVKRAGQQPPPRSGEASTESGSEPKG
jgi:hypothetical protein